MDYLTDSKRRQELPKTQPLPKMGKNDYIHLREGRSCPKLQDISQKEN